MSDKAVLYAFYTLHTHKVIETWDYRYLPIGWSLIRDGYIPEKPKVKKNYEFEEQFYGNKKNKRKMLSYLHTYFKKLQDKGIINKYSIRDFYG